MSKSLVSIIVPAYNHENYVQDTIRSLISQTYKNIELIVIDDGSKDSTWKKINELKDNCKKRFINVVFKTKPNGGTCETLNMLLNEAKGDYIYLIASDDLAKPQAIEKEVIFLENNPEYVLAVGDNEIINTKSERIGWDKSQVSKDLHLSYYKSFGEMLQDHNKNIDFYSDSFGKYETLVLKNYIPNGYLIRSSAMKSVGGFTKEAPLEDWFLMLQLSKIGKFKYIDEILFSYRWHDNNTVKRTEYMNTITYKTKLYEKNLVSKPEYKEWKEIFENNAYKTKIKFRIGNFIKYYKKEDLNYKKYILCIFGHNFVLIEKPIH